jgi:ABC-2 type transport system ATP-binding protein
MKRKIIAVLLILVALSSAWFIYHVRGAGKGESALAKVMKPIPIDDKPVIECNGLTRRFADFVATDHVTFSVRRGEIFGLLGPNCAGKSTTFKMLCGLLPPGEGEAKVAGYDLRQAASQARNRLGYMAQKFSLYRTLTVEQNLNFFFERTDIAGIFWPISVSERTDNSQAVGMNSNVETNQSAIR